MCDTTYSYVRHDAFMCAPWLTTMCGMMSSYMSHDAFIGVTRCIHKGDTTHSYVWCDACMCAPWLLHMSSTVAVCVAVCVLQYVCCSMCVAVCATRRMCEPWLLHMSATTHSHVRHDSFYESYDSTPPAKQRRSPDPSICKTRLIDMCDMTHSEFTTTRWNVHHDAFTWGTCLNIREPWLKLTYEAVSQRPTHLTCAPLPPSRQTANFPQRRETLSLGQLKTFPRVLWKILKGRLWRGVADTVAWLHRLSPLLRLYVMWRVHMIDVSRLYICVYICIDTYMLHIYIHMIPMYVYVQHM